MNKAKLYCTEFPSYPSGRSYLELIIADARLDFNNRIDYFKLLNLPYDSDHNALMASISLTPGTLPPIELCKYEKKLNLKKNRLESIYRKNREKDELKYPQ